MLDKDWLIELIFSWDEGHFQIADWGSQSSLLQNTERVEDNGKQSVSIFLRYANIYLENDSYWKVWSGSADWIMQLKMFLWIKECLEYGLKHLKKGDLKAVMGLERFTWTFTFH